MKILVENNITGETKEVEIEEVADVEIPVMEGTPQPTIEERIAAIETLYLQSEGII